MIHDVADVLDRPQGSLGEEMTIRCRIQSNRIPGDRGNGLSSVYEVSDAYHSTDEDVVVTFWSSPPIEEPLRSIVSKTNDNVLDTLGLPMELEDGTGDPLQRGEEILVRAIPNRSEGSRADLYLNATSFVVREPSRRISKGEMRSQGDCPRESYLRHVKNVYTGDRFDRPPYLRSSIFRGNAVHRIAELALEEHYERFEDDAWSEKSVKAFCEDIFETEFGFRQALLALSGVGLGSRDDVVEHVTNLFTDSKFVSLLRDADEIQTEEFLDERYGYGGRIDILLDGTPYDIKTTRDPDERRIQNHAYQLKLYLFVLTLQNLGEGDILADAVDDVRGALIYPNTSSGTPRIESVNLSMGDVAEFIDQRNEVAAGRDAFAPPSPYDRNCDGCQFAVEEWVSGEDDVLAPACTFHCQNERRWPCYELDDEGFHTECSRFDDCEQRLVYRDPDEIAHYDRIRAAFQSERRSRQTATQMIEQFDKSLLHSSGYRIPALEFVGADAAGTIVRFDSDMAVVPAFEAGETVRLESDTDDISLEATYYGRDSDEFLFNLETEGASVSDVLMTDGPFEAIYRFSVESVDRRFLPYLDFAQRRNITPGFTNTMVDGAAPPEIQSPEEIEDMLDSEEVFVDIPAQRSRSQTIEEIVEALVTATYPNPSGEGSVSEEASRALVLGTSPQLVETAYGAQPAGEHYRLDGTGGAEDVIEAEDGYHDIQTRLGESRSVVSSTQMVLSENGPEGMSEFFHRLQEGDYKKEDDPSSRDHSERFFDVLVILGGQQLTDPEYHFLSELADRVVTVGDVRRTGPKMVSSEGVEAGLEQSYFEQAFDHFSSFPDEEHASVQLMGEAPPALQELYHEGPWDKIDGDIEFLEVEGGEETALDVIELTTTVQAEHAARRLVFDVTDTPVTPVEAQELFQDRLSLDATQLDEGSVVLLDEQSMFLTEVGDVEGEKTNDHEVVIRSEAAELPSFSRAILTNSVVERIVAQVAREKSVDVIVSPFETHATEIRRRLDEVGEDVPVRRPEELSGDISDHAILSLPVANEKNLVRPPLDDSEVLYELLTSGVDLTVVGHKETLETKDFFGNLIEQATPY